MGRRQRWRHWLQALAFATAAFVIAPSAEAQTLETVTLKNGDIYEGELVERVLDDHVTIRLATGEIRRFAWADIASSDPAPLGGDYWQPTPHAPKRRYRPMPLEPIAGPPAAPLGRDPIPGWTPPNLEPFSTKVPPTDLIDVGIRFTPPQLGSPVGMVAVMFGYKPFDLLGLELDTGYDGWFAVGFGNLGWSVAETARVGPKWGGVGIGTSEHFGALGRGVAYMGHVELYFDIDFSFPRSNTKPSFVVRISPGIAGMFNGQDHPGACGIFNILGNGNTPGSGDPLPKQCLIPYLTLGFMRRYKYGGHD
jgi:hypothetical protein